MEAHELKNEIDRKHAEKAERRIRAKKRKDKPIERKEQPPKWQSE